MKGKAFIIACAGLLLIVGCAPKRAPRDSLYARLTEEPAALDWSVLEGRTIAIDPGHGGCFDGVVGLDSLREADANLGVALYLWGLLEEAGADVHLTRTTDRDFTEADSADLRADLEARTADANAFDPEVFISIHHNSNLDIDRGRNSVEIYYRSGDDGASLELANDIHTHLARNLGIEESKIKPGSYYVLRNSTAQAAVLGEASYLSNPKVEQKLKLSLKQKLEGEAYFLGLVSYFSRGIPVIERLLPEVDTVDAPVTVAFRVMPGADVPVDPAAVLIRVGNQVYHPLFDEDGITVRCALDPQMNNGRHAVICTARSVAGGTASSRPFTLTVARPPRFILPLPPVIAEGNRLSLAVKVLDENGSPVADGEMISVRSGGESFTAAGGCRRGIFRFETDRESAARPYIVECRGAIDTVRFEPPAGEKSFPVLVLDGMTGGRIQRPSATPLRGNDCAAVSGDPRGLLLLPAASAERADAAAHRSCEWIISARGYRPHLFTYAGLAGGGDPGDPSGAVNLYPLYEGVLHGMRVALDPAGGGDDDGGLGRDKLRGAMVNLEIARALAALLTRAGAEVVLTRHGDETISLVERIYTVNRFAPDLALRIGLNPDVKNEKAECAILHFPGSEKGSAVARSLAERLTGLPPCTLRSIVESAEPFLQQTSCPAAEIRGGTITRRETEQVLSKPFYAQLEAELILAAIVSSAGGGKVDPLEQGIRILEDGKPVIGAAVTIDMAVTKVTDASGLVRFSCTIPGEHLLTVRLSGERSLLLAIPLSVTDGALRIISTGP